MLPAEYDITGQVVFITGAGHGIGKRIAQVLAEAGADMVLNLTCAQRLRAVCTARQ